MVFVDGVQVVTAGLEVEPIQTEAIAALPVPEPGTVLQAAFLIAASAWLARSPRSRRSVGEGASMTESSVPSTKRTRRQCVRFGIRLPV